MFKREDKRRFDMLGSEQQQQQHHHHQGPEDDGRRGGASFSIDRQDDLSCSSSVSATESDQDWTYASKRARPSMEEGQEYADTCSGSTSQHHYLGINPEQSGHKLTGDDERRRVRRERNKLAAARCRQRRVDLTNTLLVETDGLEKEKIKLEKEIENLYRQTRELQYVLDSHSKRCRMPLDMGNSTSSDSFPAPVDLTAVKTEKPDMSTLQKPSFGNIDAKLGISRPNSLPLSSSLSVARGAETQFNGSALTPCSLTLDFMADGHTGLTPITGLPSAAEMSSSIDCPPSNPTLIHL